MNKLFPIPTKQHSITSTFLIVFKVSMIVKFVIYQAKNSNLLTLHHIHQSYTTSKYRSQMFCDAQISKGPEDPQRGLMKSKLFSILRHYLPARSDDICTVGEKQW